MAAQRPARDVTATGSGKVIVEDLLQADHIP